MTAPFPLQFLEEQPVLSERRFAQLSRLAVLQEPLGGELDRYRFLERGILDLQLP